MSGKFAYYDTGFGFTPRGTGMDATYGYVNGIYRGTGSGYLAIRPLKSVNLDSMQRVRQELGVNLSLGANNVSFGLKPAARVVLCGHQHGAFSQHQPI